MSWVEVAKELLPRGGDVAVPGGRVVFDLFLKIGFDAFHLTRAHGVRFSGGRTLFSGCDDGLSAEAARKCWIGPQRNSRSRCKAWRRHDCLARESQDRRRARRKKLVNRGRINQFTTSRRMTVFARRTPGVDVLQTKRAAGLDASIGRGSGPIGVAKEGAESAQFRHYPGRGSGGFDAPELVGRTSKEEADVLDGQLLRRDRSRGSPPAGRRGTTQDSGISGSATIRTLAFSSAARTANATFTAVGSSPWRQSESTLCLITLPWRDTTSPSRTMRRT
jgi:hypothetical protein